MNLPVTAAELANCVETHKRALVHLIRDAGRSAPPADGAILDIIRTIDCLDRIIPIDDGAGRGETSETA